MFYQANTLPEISPYRGVKIDYRGDTYVVLEPIIENGSPVGNEEGEPELTFDFALMETCGELPFDSFFRTLNARGREAVQQDAFKQLVWDAVMAQNHVFEEG